ncbi:HAD-IA family hydrolase [Patescibacteria group bacterium]|nr:HAD-IA family hydrolase [Patescibacteria group bacterium]
MEKRLGDFRWAVVDLDGTLFDSKKLFRKVLKLLAFLGLGFDSSGDNSSFENLAYRFFERIEGKNPRLFKGAREFLEKLKNSNVKILISTGSKLAIAERELDYAGVDFFEIILGREIPKKEHLLSFTKELNISLERFASDTFFIGDQLFDMKLAKKYGIHGIGITNTVNRRRLIEAGAEKVVESFKQLIELI